jgi:hypothetical protein
MLPRVATVTIAKTINGANLLCVTIGSISFPESMAVGAKQKIAPLGSNSIGAQSMLSNARTEESLQFYKVNGATF